MNSLWAFGEGRHVSSWSYSLMADLANKGQRLKGAIDSRIQEEQNRAKAASASPITRSTSNARRSASNRTGSPSGRPNHSRVGTESDIGTSGVRGPDPAEFEAAFVVDDDSVDVSRVGTPVPDVSMAPDEKSALPTSTMESSEASNETIGDSIPRVPVHLEVAPDIRAKLRKLDKLEAKYPGEQAQHQSAVLVLTW